MSRDWRQYVHDIRASCGKIVRFTDGMDLVQFRADEKTYDAVLRNLEIIGEAAKHVPDKVRDTMREVPWRKISGGISLLMPISVWTTRLYGTWCETRFPSCLPHFLRLTPKTKRR